MSSRVLSKTLPVHVKFTAGRPTAAGTETPWRPRRSRSSARPVVEEIKSAETAPIDLSRSAGMIERD